MVIRTPRSARGGWFVMDLAVAMGLLLFLVLPLAFSFSHERQLTRDYYHRAIATELVDGEFEALLAGEWKHLPEGRQIYSVKERAAANLPPGQFLFTRHGTSIRLEWRPARGGGRVFREAVL